MRTQLANTLTAGLMAVATGAWCSAALADGPAMGGSLKDAPAAEEPKRDLVVTYNFALTSDYVFRGISQSNSRPAVQGGVDATYKWLYLGAWSSLIDFGKDGNFPTRDVAHTELDLYAGIKPVVGKVTFDLGVIYYTYPSARSGGIYSNRDFNYVELKLGASGDIWKDGTLSGTFFYSPNGTNDTGEVYTLEGTFTQVLAKIRDITPSVSGTLGYQAGDDIRYRTIVANGASDYLYWNVGTTLGFGDRFSLDFRYWDTNISNAGSFCSQDLFGCDSRFVATAKVTY